MLFLANYITCYRGWFRNIEVSVFLQNWKSPLLTHVGCPGPSFTAAKSWHLPTPGHRKPWVREFSWPGPQRLRQELPQKHQNNRMWCRGHPRGEIMPDWNAFLHHWFSLLIEPCLSHLADQPQSAWTICASLVSNRLILLGLRIGRLALQPAGAGSGSASGHRQREQQQPLQCGHQKETGGLFCGQDRKSVV